MTRMVFALQSSPGISARQRFAGLLALIVVLSQFAGCYYVQAVRGHYDIMKRRQPIPEVIANEDSPDELRQRLKIVQQARAFAVEELLLADNDSYTSYADLGRDYVVWNVFAAPEFSLEPKTWCFPVAGCVAYRGYFAEQDAQDKAQQLRDDGFDVTVSGVSAYSTLGRFDDPVLNTMMRWSDTRLVATIFHELAHQKLYVKGDTAFNESFATAVADVGIGRWLEQRDQSDRARQIARNRELRRRVMSRVEAYRARLRELYSSDAEVAVKRQRKRALLDELAASAAELFAGSGESNWLAGPLNNAHLVPLGLYQGYEVAFARLYDDCRQDLSCFYAESKKLADLDADERRQRLEQAGD